MIVGVIMTMTKFHSQLLLVPSADPLARACSGKISGTYTQGMQLTVAV